MKAKNAEKDIKSEQILKVIQIIHRQALQTPLILVYKIRIFTRLFQNINAKNRNK